MLLRRVFAWEDNFTNSMLIVYFSVARAYLEEQKMKKEKRIGRVSWRKVKIIYHKKIVNKSSEFSSFQKDSMELKMKKMISLSIRAIITDARVVQIIPTSERTRYCSQRPRVVRRYFVLADDWKLLHTPAAPCDRQTRRCQFRVVLLMKLHAIRYLVLETSHQTARLYFRQPGIRLDVCCKYCHVWTVL